MSVKKEKDGRYSIRGYRKGPTGEKERFYKKLETTKKSEAEKIEAQEKLKFFSEPIQGEQPEGTLTQAVNAYKTSYANNITEGTLKIVERYLQKHWLPYFGDCPVNEITLMKVEGYRTYRLSQKPKNSRGLTSKSTVNRELGFLKSVMEKALRVKVIKRNPFIDFKIKRFQEQEKMEFFERNEWDAFLQGLESSGMGKMVPYFITLLETGSRLGEIAELLVFDIKFDDRLINIRQQKTGNQKTLPMSDYLISVLKKHLLGLENKTGLVFPDKNGNRMSNPTVQYAFRKGLQAAGITKRLSVHAIRRTSASWSIRATGSIYKVSKLLGHTSVQHSQRYARLLPEDLRDMVEGFAPKTGNSWAEPKKAEDGK